MKHKVFLRAPYNYDTDIASEESGLVCPEETLTIQSEKDDADINLIVERFKVTGTLPQRDLPPMLGDFLEVTDFHTAQNIVRQAQESFNELDGKIRARFNNDPGEFIAFCEESGNLEELRKMGLAVKPEDIPDERLSEPSEDVRTKGDAPGSKPGADPEATRGGP